MLWEGRSDRVWIVLGGVKRPSFLLGSFGPFSSPSFEAPSFAAGLEGFAAASPSAGGVRTAVLQSAGDSAHDLQGYACHGALLIFHLHFYPLLSPSFKRLTFFSLSVLALLGHAVLYGPGFGSRIVPVGGGRPFFAVVVAVAAFDLGARGALFGRRVLGLRGVACAPPS